MAISGDGRTLVVGAPGKYGNDDRPGCVKVYYKQFDLSGWKWKLAETFTGKESGDKFGKAVSMSEDGKTIAISLVMVELLQSGLRIMMIMETTQEKLKCTGWTVVMVIINGYKLDRA